MTTIDIEHLSKVYGNKIAVKDLTIKFEEGQIVALLGENGAGKSTLLNMVSGFLAPTAGKITINGDDLALKPEKVKSQIGFLPEGSPLYDDMEVSNFLSYMADLKSANRSNVTEVIKLANLEDVKDCKIETLSKGYRRRVGFAVSLLNNPQILLLDEPTDGLDPNQKTHLLNLISNMGKEKIIIISTHLLDEVQMIADRIMIMHKGEIRADGSLDAIMEQNKTTSLDEAFVKLTR
ncbi:MAG: ABC transporter ATP-binding protein [Alphaproteobacteria bacterium]|nr:ABC transporter ATP-binding protein [Alphaproteobacteria bacterium]